MNVLKNAPKDHLDMSMTKVESAANSAMKN